jgi:phosphoglycerate dehydrogenase-like enzyme
MRIWLPGHPDEFEIPTNRDVVFEFADGLSPIPENRDGVSMMVLPMFAGRHALLEVLRNLPDLKVVQSMSAGVEDVIAHIPPGVALCTASSAHHDSTAEMAMALLLASMRGIPEFAKDYAWERRMAHVWPSLADRHVLLVGHGSIGQAIARRLEGFECRVTPVARTARPGILGVESLDQVLPSADVVVISVPVTQESHRMFDDRRLSSLKDGALLVNVSRGSIIDTDALTDHVLRGRISVALDVTDPEPLPPGHPLLRHGNALITPHVAGRSTALEPRLRKVIREQVLRHIKSEPLMHVVTGGY